MLLYRFKSARSILEQFHELENQIIHFSPREDLNDPLEGYTGLYWQGDCVAWKGLFKNYISCLESSFSMYRLEAKKQQLRTIPIFLVESTLPTKAYQKLINQITTEFINSSTVEKIITRLGNENVMVTRNDLGLFLSMVHIEGIKIIIKYHCLYGLMEKSEGGHFADTNSESRNIDMILDAYVKIEEDEEINKKKVLFKSVNSMLGELALNGKVFVDMTDEEQRMEWYYLSSEFPKKYLNQIENLIHPPCYLACFSKSFSNSSMWGNYTDKHKGICIIFRTNEENNNYYIPIEQVNSFDSKGAHKCYIDTKLVEVIYGGEYTNINFFEMLGRLNGKQIEYWFKDGDKKSCIIDKIKGEEDTWRKKYWEIFNKRYNTKTVEWGFEEEYRLRIESGLSENYDSNESRNLKYQFDSLEGIIFGIETLEIDKVRILEIISEKCVTNKRDVFKIYQAYFDEETRTIKSSELKIIERNVIQGKYIKTRDLRSKLQRKVLQAIDMLYEKDEYLIRNNQNENRQTHVGERAIVFRLGIYLEGILKSDSKFVKYNLDNEYNGNAGEVKQLPGHGNELFPNIILHKRGIKDENILVIEIKTWWNQDIRADIKKLQVFTDSSGQYRYKVGLSIILDKYKPTLKWFENGAEIVANK
ncbi:DUF2971 domain-containing protein [Clostridium estertheticum]|uniref:DUF2971 domain-containing protein n=1 Tax=Clostridium estertheticum TaxID=238834 RepID=UPI001C0C4AED|nr:DUF2971 domain-containing protein [Clostridium estertheticum]MBU3176293.1 DUF2971 domain-containing protein [Clostridium estertheticum]